MFSFLKFNFLQKQYCLKYYHYVFFASVLILILVTQNVRAENIFDGIQGGTPKVVQIDSGKLRGFEQKGIVTFLGIPYAAPPVDELRWMPPAPVTPWQGVRDAGRFGGFALQTSLLGVFGERTLNEYCLYLNVFAPADAATRNKPLPVMIWIHGGGLINGRSDDYDARQIALKGDVIVVTINYRLNLMGFFSHPALSAEGHPTNYGILDQQAAMRWVQKNISAFGGDPKNVTLFGESAGGLSITMNMVSPSAEGLFHKVILMSGVPVTTLPSREEGEQAGIKFADALGCSNEADVAACLRSKSIDEIIEKAGNYTADTMRTYDGEVIPGPIQELFAKGAFHKVPVIMGNTHDESTWFVSFNELNTGQPLTSSDYHNRLITTFGSEEAAKLIEQEYPAANYSSPSDALSIAQTSWQFICPNRRAVSSLVDYVPVYVYEFMDTTAPQYFDPVSFTYGAAHTLELQYLFPRFHGSMGTQKTLSADQTLLSDTMIAYWTNFALSADPNGPKLPNWPSWNSNKQTQLLDLIVETATTYGVDRKCDFWDSLSTKLK